MYHTVFYGKHKYAPIFQFLIFFYFLLVMNAVFQNIHVPILNKKNYFNQIFAFHFLGLHNGITVVLSSFVTETDGQRNCETFCRDAYSLKPELNSGIKEAHARLIPHVKMYLKEVQKLFSNQMMQMF